MTNDENTAPRERRQWSGGGYTNGAGAVYCFGLIGALVYFIQHATSFWNGAFGVLKALVWPAILVYELLGFFKL